MLYAVVQVLDTLAEINERHEAVKELEKSLMELHQVFLDMAVLVEAQGEMLDNIEQQVAPLALLLMCLHRLPQGYKYNTNRQVARRSVMLDPCWPPKPCSRPISSCSIRGSSCASSSDSSAVQVTQLMSGLMHPQFHRGVPVLVHNNQGKTVLEFYFQFLSSILSS